MQRRVRPLPCRVHDLLPVGFSTIFEDLIVFVKVMARSKGLMLVSR